MKNTAETFHWLISLFQKHDVPFVVTGGLAARYYGSARPLNDIDVDIKDADFSKIVDEVKPYITFGPGRYCDAKWDLLLMTLNYAGQEIDIGSNNAKIYNSKNQEWTTITTDFSTAEPKEIFGLTVPVIAPAALIFYNTNPHKF